MFRATPANDDRDVMIQAFSILPEAERFVVIVFRKNRNKAVIYSDEVSDARELLEYASKTLPLAE